MDNGTSIDFVGAAEVDETTTETAGETITSRRGWILGGWLDRAASGQVAGAGFGYRAVDLTEAPLACGVVVFVESEQQLEQAMELSESLFQGGEGPCVAQR